MLKVLYPGCYASALIGYL